MLVEDNFDDEFLVQHWLRRNGIRNHVISYSSAEPAKRFLTERARSENGHSTMPTLALLSLTLAGGGGMELLQWIRGRPEYNRVLILALGNSALEQDIQKAYNMGANGYFAKGIDFDDLAGVLHSLDFLNYAQK